MIGKQRLDLTVNPPPDLAIEIDVTSETGLDAYQALGVAELWRFEDGQLQISVLQNGEYQDAMISPHFPNFAIVQTITRFLEQSQTEGRSQTLKAFRPWVRSQLG